MVRRLQKENYVREFEVLEPLENCARRSEMLAFRTSMSPSKDDMTVTLRTDRAQFQTEQKQNRKQNESWRDSQADMDFEGALRGATRQKTCESDLDGQECSNDSNRLRVISSVA